jgi:predicted metal-dependent phosphoesterase TrpH
MNEVIDLHSHTDESDGSLTPAELVGLAVNSKLHSLAITDHDTFAGYEKAVPLARSAGLDLLQGIELNSRIEMNGTATGRFAHILAYFPVERPSQAFLEWLEETRRNRRERNEKLVASLQAAGIDITLGEVEARGRSLAGRPHFARILVDKGYANSLEDAFDRYIGEDAPSYVRRESLTTEETISRVREGGGIPVVAHPIRLGFNPSERREFLLSAKKAGLLGLEVYHSEHSAMLQTELLAEAKALGLLPTGGSDYHGPSVKPDIVLGTGRGNVNVPLAFLTALRETASGLRKS